MNLKKRVKKRQRPRDSLTFLEFKVLLGCVPVKSKFMRPRLTVAFLIMYITGLRMGNLLSLSVGDLKRFLDGQQVYVSLLKKRGPWPHPIQLTAQDVLFLKEYSEDFEILIQNKLNACLLFSPPGGCCKAIDRSELSRGLNQVCKEASEILNKHIRTHSLRVTYISNALVYNRVEVVRKIVGHSSIKDTLGYDRRPFTEEQKREFDTNLDLIKYLDE